MRGPYALRAIKGNLYALAAIMATVVGVGLLGMPQATIYVPPLTPWGQPLALDTHVIGLLLAGAGMVGLLVLARGEKRVG